MLSACLYPLPRLRCIGNSVFFPYAFHLWCFNSRKNYISLIRAKFFISQLYYWFKIKHITERCGVMVDSSSYSIGTLRDSNRDKGIYMRNAVALGFQESTFESLRVISQYCCILCGFSQCIQQNYIIKFVVVVSFQISSRL